MRTSLLHIFTFAILLLSFTGAAQVSRVEELLLENKRTTGAYERSALLPGRKQAFLETGFSNGNITNPSVLKELEGKVIESIELVYTQYSESPDFDQAGLNRKRLQALRSALPSVVDNPLITWTLIAQQPKTTSEARGLFHGFVITYRPEPTEESMKAEIMYLEHALSKITGKSTGTVTGTVPAASDSAWDFNTNIKVERNDTLMLQAVREAGLELIDTIYDTGLHGRRIFYVFTTESKTLPDLFSSINDYLPYGFDSVIMKTFTRNMSDWKNIMIVGDMTGSMSPYTAQLLAWYKINAQAMPVKRFVFFNDGNRMPDSDKMPGETGGIYSRPTENFEQVMELAKETMRNGGGGDVPENNLEAVLYAIEQCGDCEIVMIADNLASPRDFRLVSKVKRPVKVIVCGAQTGLNPDYLDIARATGGSVHLMEEDITSLSAVKEGETIVIGKQKFRLERGRFMAVQ